MSQQNNHSGVLRDAAGSTLAAKQLMVQNRISCG
jgi:hypothetical protein